MIKASTYTLSIVLMAAAAACMWPASTVDTKNEGAFIIDRTGEKWDVSQAESLGFKPERFRHGIGRHAFRTLDDSHVASIPGPVSEDLRVIGIAAGGEAHAYSVPKLTRHEIANTTVGTEVLAVGY
jgi:hypothetical protein